MDDLISRQAAIEAITAQSGVVDKSVAKRVLSQLPPAQPNAVPRTAYAQAMYERDTAIKQLAEIGKGLGEKMDDAERIVRCKDCRKHNSETCPLVAYRGKAQGHEFDYQYCVFGKRKEE